MRLTWTAVKATEREQVFTNDFDIDGCTGSSQFVLQSHFVLSCISMKAAVHLQVAGRVLLPVGQGQG